MTYKIRLPSSRSWLWSAAFWLLFGGIQFANAVWRLGGVEFQASVLALYVMSFAPYAIVTPPMFVLGDYLVRDVGRGRRFWKIVGLTLVGASVVHGGLEAIFYSYAGPGSLGIVSVLLGSSLMRSLHYAAILGAALVVAQLHLGEERRRELLAAQLRVLRGQLQPHFLFNALHAVGVSARQDPETTARMVALLGDLLRRSLRERTSDFVTLAEELDLLQPYLDLQRLRFADRLRIEVDVADDVRSVAVPDLLLQPLVENALQHGIERRPDAGSVRIVARRDGDVLELQIADDGAGLGAHAGPDSERIGLGATRARLEALYGDATELRLADAIGGGATVIVRLPLRELPRAA